MAVENHEKIIAKSTNFKWAIFSTIFYGKLLVTKEGKWEDKLYKVVPAQLQVGL